MNTRNKLITINTDMPSRTQKNIDSLFILKSGTIYYGVIKCLGEITVIHTHDLFEATLYGEQEAEEIKNTLASRKIQAVIEPYMEEKIRYSGRIWYSKAKEAGHEFNKKRRTTKDIFIGLTKL